MIEAEEEDLTFRCLRMRIIDRLCQLINLILEWTMGMVAHHQLIIRQDQEVLLEALAQVDIVQNHLSLMLKVALPIPLDMPSK